ncbi:hypothetical protein WA026_018106 [Henosepilachna vigintioctopunctata]|uniref:NADH dehydrogenase [ubiquinone] 1 beta subcomplex subunit 5, mitochondrial n=1 Tax=Henosepilachna vigintioctopunctata TaxID=420089 RepID=A0AAW1UPK7_9CUCU
MILSKLRSFGVISRKFVNSAIFQRKMSEHRTFAITPSRFSWDKFKDMVHFYILLGAIPATIFITYCNVFIGPATLSEIPPDYIPKHWEYYRNPVTRLIAKYTSLNHQQEYEKYLAYIFMEDEKRLLRKIQYEVKEKIKERDDYQAYYYRPVLAKYVRQSKEAADYIESIRGD